jgi:hypothetical protein
MWEFIRKFDWFALAVGLSFAGAQAIIIVPSLIKEPVVRYCYEGEEPEYKPEGIRLGITVSCRAHWVERNRDGVELSAAVVTAAFTVFLGISTYWLWLATRASVDLGREEFVATHRPKLRVRKVQLDEDERSKRGESVLSFICRNEGETAATITNVATAFIQSSVPSRITNPPELKSWSVKIRLAVGQDVRLETVDKIAMDGGIDLAIANGSWGQFFVGEITYSDDVGVSRKMGFARKCDEFYMWKPYDDEEYEYSY